MSRRLIDKLVVTTFLTLSVGLLTRSTASGQQLVYYNDLQGPGHPSGLYNYDVPTGISTLRTAVAAGPYQQFIGWDVRPSDGMLFTVSLFGAGLFTVDPNTGKLSLVGYTGLGTGPSEIGGGLGIYGLAFDPKTDILYALQSLTGNLYSINPNTAAATFIGTNGLGVDSGLSFSPITGKLYAYPSDDSRDFAKLYEISPLNGTATFVGLSDQINSSRLDSAFTPSGQMFGITYAGDIYKIDTNTGQTTLVGPTSFFGAGLFVIPEPSTLALLGLGAVGLLMRRHR